MLVIRMFFIKDTIHFSYRDYNCNYDTLSAPTWYVRYFLIGACVTVLISYIALIVTSALLLMVARRAAGRRLQWRGVITVLLTVGVLLLSYLPTIVMIVVDDILGLLQQSPTVRRTVQYMQLINIMSNFFVYVLTVLSFRTFLKLKISSTFSQLSLLCQQRPSLSLQQGPPLQQGPLNNRIPLKNKDPFSNIHFHPSLKKTSL